MESTDLDLEAWAKEIGQLSARFGNKTLLVQVQWSFGHLLAIVSRCWVDGKTLRVLLRQQSPEDSAQGGLAVYLPEPGQGAYSKHENEAGEIVLTLQRKGTGISDLTVVHLASGSDVLNAVNYEFRPE